MKRMYFFLEDRKTILRLDLVQCSLQIRRWSWDWYMLGNAVIVNRKSSVAEESARSSRDSGRRCRKLQAAAAVRRSQLCFTLNGEEIRNTSEKVRTFLITEEMSLMEKTKKLRAYDPAIKRPAAQRESLRCSVGRMLRRRLGVVFTAALLTPALVLFFLTSPADLSGEQALVQRMAELRERLHHAEMLNQERLQDVILLSRKFNLIIEPAPEGGNVTGFRAALSQETRELLTNLSHNSDMHLPSIYSYLPHLLHTRGATTPAFKLSKGRHSATMVLGVPTVKRQVQSYLMTTLGNLINSMSTEEMEECIIVVFVAEWDLDYVRQVASQIERKFPEHLESGLLEVISPPQSFYPDMDKLRQTLGDPMERVRWRTKQNLDFAFLMMYSQPKGTFYVQLEDDIQTKKGYIATMKKFALQKTSEKKNWFVLDFCQLGFIGKMFKCVELPYLVQFFIMFYNDKPVDWLLDYLIQTKICNLDKDTDKQFGKIQLFFPHDNPTASVETQIKPYKAFTLQRAYKGESYFWGLLPQQGDKLQFKFEPPVVLKGFLFRSGNVEHPSDRLYNTTVEVLPTHPLSSLTNYQKEKLKITEDNYVVVGDFDDMGVAEGTIDESFGTIKSLRLNVHVESDNWAILSEIHIETPDSR
ncbi:alpha-1,3-mannosyl-glycoprotein 4-beta-N-acetylglucosaminyltransferase A isoform X7 [Procambarus clarkii]|uniref:alpha-1,3-mannosyl-glycoprotein 4-beta-N-acetylglucosaminyltransferase A isoform X7 n=1 Tax=Procambarus clarkii TaxID=6728 RepID=UPI0037440404